MVRRRTLKARICVRILRYAAGLGVSGGSVREPDDSNPRSFSHRSRKRRFRLIEEMLRALISERSESDRKVSILDVGGRAQYWRLMDESLYDHVSVTLLNLEEEEGFWKRAPEGLEISAQVGDGCDMWSIADGAFDFCHSNSVIEHVGSLHNMARFADETRRVARAYYHQTPNLFFPIEPHYGVPFLHWLPGPLRASLTTRYKLGYGIHAADFREALEIVDHTEIVTPGLMRRLFPDAEMRHERFLLLSKSMIVRRGPGIKQPEEG